MKVLGRMMIDNDHNFDISVALKLVLVVVISTVIGLSTHIYLLKIISPVIAERMQGVVIQKPPYSVVITTIAYITFVFPAIGTVLVYYFIQDVFPGKSRVVKGVLFGLLILLVKGELLRQPIMNFIVGNPIKITLLQQSQVWLSNLIMCVIIALFTPALQVKLK